MSWALSDSGSDSIDDGMLMVYRFRPHEHLPRRMLGM